MKRQPPGIIEVPFEYENNVKTSYYCLEMACGNVVERVALTGIEGFCRGLDKDEAMETSVSFWEPSQYGWDLIWRISADEFLARAKLVEIKKRVRR